MIAVNPEFVRALIETAKSKVGVREVGNNGGAAVRAFQSATWLDTGPWPWCAAFICWAWMVAATRFPAMAAIRPQTPSAEGLLVQLSQHGFRVEKNPKAFNPGAIVLFTFPTGHHVGIAASRVMNGEFQSIEGNTGDAGGREGDGVYLKTRNLKYVTACCHLA